MRARREAKVIPIMMSSVRRLMWLLKYLLCAGRKLLKCRESVEAKVLVFIPVKMPEVSPYRLPW